MILANPQALSSKYIPRKLPHRDPQLKQLSMFFSDLSRGFAFFKSVQLIGSVGTGKTSTSLLFVRGLESSFGNVKAIYVNLKMLGDPSPWTVYTAILRQVSGRASRSLSAGEVFEKIVGEFARRRPVSYLFIVDEADELTSSKSLRGGRVVYNLTRLPEFGIDNVLGVIFIARNEEWSYGLAPEERSSLGGLVVRFPPYTLPQLVDILLYRASEAFSDPSSLPDTVAEHIAKITIDLFEGDVRKALDILLYASLIADNEHSEKVTFTHVSKALAQMLDKSCLDEEVVKSLRQLEKLVLAATLEALRHKDSPYTSEREIVESVQILCERLGVREPRKEEIESALQRLHDLGILKMSGPLRVYAHVVPVFSDVKSLIQ
jgi:cell division control protein 6